MNVLILEDAQYRIKDFRSYMPFAKIIKHADDCIEQLEKAEEPWDILFLDHDLDNQTYVDPEEFNTGSEVVRWIVKNKPEIKQIIIHSHNEEAGESMRRDLYLAGYNVKRHPFLSLKLDQFSGNET
jgi:DNA-binding NarL/FixJ family response regulator